MDGDSLAILASLCQCVTALTVTHMFWAQMEYPGFSLCVWPLVVLVGITEKSD